MLELNIDSKLAGKKIERALSIAFPDLHGSALFKAARNKDIKVNGVRVKHGYFVCEGDHVQAYIDYKVQDNIPAPTIIYEDSNIIIVDKPQGLEVHPSSGLNGSAGGGKSLKSLIEIVNEGLRSPVSAMLCHRLDRNTGGLVIIAKNRESLEYVEDMMKEGQIEKYYKCLVSGKMEKTSAVLHAWHKKDSIASHVTISDNERRGWSSITTAYKVIRYYPRDDISLLEVKLITGRTHQIRAHMAYIGHPLIGDGKYGRNELNKTHKANVQALWACRLEFRFGTNEGVLGYLCNRVFEVEPKFTV